MATVPEEALANKRSTPATRPASNDAELRIPGRPGRLKRHEPTLIGTASVVLVLVIWQAVASAELVKELFLPGPLSIVNAFVVLFRQGAIWNDIWISGQEVVYG